MHGNIKTTLTFASVIILLAVTLFLGIVTVINDKTGINKNDNDKYAGVTGTPTGEITRAPEEITVTPGEILTPTATKEPVLVTGTPTATPTIGISHIVCLDPGHQMKANTEQEEIAEGSGKTASKMSSTGAISVYDYTNEFQWNMCVADLIKDELRARGYTVIMTRESNEVDVSNKERALIANEANAEILVGIQTDAFDDQSVKGMYAQIPASDNPYVDPENITKSETLADKILTSVTTATGARKRAYQYGNNEITMINWAKMPVCIMQFGYMTNYEEAEKLADETYQKLIVTSVCDGIDAYFAEIDK